MPNNNQKNTQSSSGPNPAAPILDNFVAFPQKVNLDQPKTDISSGLADIPPVVFNSNTSNIRAGNKFGGKKMVATILGILVLVGGIGAGVFLTRQNQNISEKAWFYATDPQTGTQCPAFGGYTSEQIGTFQGDCLINYCPQGFTNACSAKVTPGAWSEIKKCSEITSLESKNYCGQVDYLGSNNLYCNIKSPDCQSGQTGGCGAKELTQLDLNGNNVKNEAVDCVNTPVGPSTPTPTPSVTATATATATAIATSTPTSASCQVVEAYKVSGDIDVTANWTKLTSTELTLLNSGDIVYFLAKGIHFSGYSNIDKVQIIVNSQTIDATKKDTGLTCPQTIGSPCNFEYYAKYTVPSAITTFAVSARLHDSISDTWF